MKEKILSSNINGAVQKDTKLGKAISSWTDFDNLHSYVFTSPIAVIAKDQFSKTTNRSSNIDIKVVDITITKFIAVAFDIDYKFTDGVKPPAEVKLRTLAGTVTTSETITIGLTDLVTVTGDIRNVMLSGAASNNNDTGKYALHTNDLSLIYSTGFSIQYLDKSTIVNNIINTLSYYNQFGDKTNKVLANILANGLPDVESLTAWLITTYGIVDPNILESYITYDKSNSTITLFETQPHIKGNVEWPEKAGFYKNDEFDDNTSNWGMCPLPPSVGDNIPYFRMNYSADTIDPDIYGPMCGLPLSYPDTPHFQRVGTINVETSPDATVQIPIMYDFSTGVSSLCWSTSAWDANPRPTLYYDFTDQDLANNALLVNIPLNDGTYSLPTWILTRKPSIQYELTNQQTLRVSYYGDDIASPSTVVTSWTGYNVSKYRTDGYDGAAYLANPFPISVVSKYTKIDINKLAGDTTKDPRLFEDKFKSIVIALKDTVKSDWDNRNTKYPGNDWRDVSDMLSFMTIQEQSQYLPARPKVDTATHIKALALFVHQQFLIPWFTNIEALLLVKGNDYSSTAQFSANSLIADIAEMKQQFENSWSNILNSVVVYDSYRMDLFLKHAFDNIMTDISNVGHKLQSGISLEGGLTGGISSVFTEIWTVFSTGIEALGSILDGDIGQGLKDIFNDAAGIVNWIGNFFYPSEKSNITYHPNANIKGWFVGDTVTGTPAITLNNVTLIRKDGIALKNNVYLSEIGNISCVDYSGNSYWFPSYTDLRVLKMLIQFSQTGSNIDFSNYIPTQSINEWKKRIINLFQVEHAEIIASIFEALSFTVVNNVTVTETYQQILNQFVNSQSGATRFLVSLDALMLRQSDEFLRALGLNTNYTYDIGQWDHEDCTIFINSIFDCNMIQTDLEYDDFSIMDMTLTQYIQPIKELSNSSNKGVNPISFSITGHIDSDKEIRAVADKEMFETMIRALVVTAGIYGLIRFVCLRSFASRMLASAFIYGTDFIGITGDDLITRLLRGDTSTPELYSKLDAIEHGIEDYINNTKNPVVTNAGLCRLTLPVNKKRRR